MKVKELLNFDEIKDVIDIDNDIDDIDSSRAIVENYIFSKNIKGHLDEMVPQLADPKHKSAQIIGNYGSGKSHLLALLAAILDNPELVDYIQDEEVKKLFSEHINRNYAVVQFELQSSAAPMSHFFYDRVVQMLNRKYDINIPDIDPEKIYNHKEKIEEILDKVKAKDSQMGLVVIVDEISDFLKQKETKEMKNRDNQFLRVLGQASQSMDFVFIGSMQENILTDPKFIDEKDAFGRVSERFHLITISKEDIKKVIANRILSKDISQREKLRDLLEEYGQQIPQVQQKIDEFIDLFPVHPYLIEIFNQLPYFERRGVIKFTNDKVKEVLDKEFPVFITYDRIFDEISSKPMIKVLDEVYPVVNAVNTLSNKIDLLRESMQEDAKKVIKALAILKLYGKTTNNGATPQELANELLVIDDKFTNTDRIKLILNKLREVTDGQFIAKTKNDYYYIDLEHDIDYDVVIKRKAENLYDGAEDDELLKVLIRNFELDSDSDVDRIFSDYSYWKDKKSFREGYFIYDDGLNNINVKDGDFKFVFVSPYQSESSFSGDEDTSILEIKFNEELDDLLKKVAAISALKRSSSYPRNVMDNKQREYLNQIEDSLIDILKNSSIKNGGSYETTGHLFAQEPNNLREYYYEVKPALFSDHFTEKYPEYPDLTKRLSPDNIKSEVERTINEILSEGEKILVKNLQDLLAALDLLDNDNFLETSNSKYAQYILDILRDNEGKNIKIDRLVNELAEKPFGLNKELVYLILIVLTYNGEINMKQRGGRTITSSDLSQLFSTGINKFKDVPYVSLEKDFPVDKIIRLFKILELPVGLVRNKSERSKALKVFKEKVIELNKKVDEVEKMLDSLESKPREFVNIETILNKRSGLENLQLNRLNDVNTINDFKKLRLDEEEFEKLEIGLNFLNRLYEFLVDFNEEIYTEYYYLRASLKFINENNFIFKKEDINNLKNLADSCEEIINADGVMPLLDHEQRRLLKGKIEQYKRKYKALYFNTHKEKVGQNINWENLIDTKNSQEIKRLDNLKSVRSVINTNKFTSQVLKIHELLDYRCEKLKEDHLKDNYKCPFCEFPSTDNNDLINLNETIDDIWNTIIDINEDWEERILTEISNYKDNLDKLVPSEKKDVNKIIEENKLPDSITSELIKALNNLFSELEEVKLTKSKLLEILFKDSDVLDFNMFQAKLEDIKGWVLSHGSEDNIRIKLKNISEEE